MPLAPFAPKMPPTMPIELDSPFELPAFAKAGRRDQTVLVHLGGIIIVAAILFSIFDNRAGIALLLTLFVYLTMLWVGLLVGARLSTRYDKVRQRIAQQWLHDQADACKTTYFEVVSLEFVWRKERYFFECSNPLLAPQVSQQEAADLLERCDTVEVRFRQRSLMAMHVDGDKTRVSRIVLPVARVSVDHFNLLMIPSVTFEAASMALIPDSLSLKIAAVEKRLESARQEARVVAFGEDPCKIDDSRLREELAALQRQRRRRPQRARYDMGQVASLHF